MPYSQIVVTFNFIYFSNRKNQIALKIYIHTQKSMENKKKHYWEMLKKSKIYQLNFFVKVNLAWGQF